LIEGKGEKRSEFSNSENFPSEDFFKNIHINLNKLKIYPRKKSIIPPIDLFKN